MEDEQEPEEVTVDKKTTDTVMTSDPPARSEQPSGVGPTMVEQQPNKPGPQAPAPEGGREKSSTTIGTKRTNTAASSSENKTEKNLSATKKDKKAA